MNKQELAVIEKKARRIAQNSFKSITLEDDRGKRTGYAIVIDEHIYGSPESFYEDYPEQAPRQPKRVYGPYRVKNIGVNGNVYKVVEMIDNETNTYESLRPDTTYLNRQSAYGKCLRLNKRWQEDHEMDSDDNDLLEYWKNATN